MVDAEHGLGLLDEFPKVYMGHGLVQGSRGLEDRFELAFMFGSVRWTGLGLGLVFGFGFGFQVGDDGGVAPGYGLSLSFAALALLPLPLLLLPALLLPL